MGNTDWTTPVLTHNSVCVFLLGTLTQGWLKDGSGQAVFLAHAQ